MWGSIPIPIVGVPLISTVPPFLPWGPRADYHVGMLISLVGVFGQVDPAVVESSRRVPNDSVLSNDSYVQTIVSYQTIVIGARASERVLARPS
jgi:hypothetical protein